MITPIILFSRDSPQLTMFTDSSSKIGWGAILGDKTCGDNWTSEEKKRHINYLELQAVYLACKSFKNLIRGKHV